MSYLDAVRSQSTITGGSAHAVMNHLNNCQSGAVTAPLVPVVKSLLNAASTGSVTGLGIARYLSTLPELVHVLSLIHI